MADPPTSTMNPARRLRRAQVVKEVADESPSMPGSPPPKTNGFGASIRRQFLKARSAVSRSKSLNGTGHPTHSTATSEAEEETQKTRQKGHSRSLSDVSAALPRSDVLVAPPNVPPPMESAQSHSERLPSVSECPPISLPTTAVVDLSSSPAIGNVRVPQLLQQGTPMTKVSLKKHKKFVFRLDADLGQIVWESKKHKIIPIENIKEIRSGDDARYYREQFQLSQDYQDRWLTLSYLLDGNYKTLHLIAATTDVFRMWDRTLRELHAIRLELMRGLGNVEMRQALWEKHYWKGADEESDQKLTFEEVEKLCRRLNINSNGEDLLRLFKQADSQKHDFLDFDDFRRFVKLLKARPEIDRLYKKLKADNNGVFDFGVFEKFMAEEQESSLSSSGLQKIFDKYSKLTIPTDHPEGPATCPESNLPSSSTIPAATCPGKMTVDAFASFLLSPDNSVFADQHKDTWQDMTRPLSEYFVSSSHNTYLVGHQLVGVSTIEGYIRALLHSCRSVELDIYDGEQEPMIFHGKTFTSKVSLREVCQTVAKYGFVASPYPIIISAEVHCGLAGQEMIAEIMIKEFGDSLIRIPVDNGSSTIVRERIEQLPSPEDLKGKILLKAKNRNLARADSVESDRTSSTDPSSSASDSDALFEMMKDVIHLPAHIEEKKENDKEAEKKHRRQSESTVKDQLAKAGTNIMKRVKSVGKSATMPAPLSLLSPSSPRPSTSFIQPQPLPPPTAIVPPSSASTTFSALSQGLKSPTSLSAGRTSDVSGNGDGRPPKPKMSFALLALLVYTVGVKFRGINKKEEYAPEHIFSLSENTANKMLRFGMWDLIKHTKTHMVRTYPKGMRLSSTNYEPHRFWAAGAQLVAINWQTFDLGYMINHAMFQRNGRSGYVLKPDAIRLAHKERLAKRTMHSFDVTIISAQQLPRPRDASGHEVPEKAIVDPYVEVTLYVPDWPVVLDHKTKEKEREKEKGKDRVRHHQRPTTPTAAVAAAAATVLPIAVPAASPTPGHAVSSRTSVVRKNGWNPVWEEKLRIPFDCVGDMMDLIFVRFVVRQEDKDAVEPLAVYCGSLGSLQHGYRHLPLHDSQLSQYLFSTLFVRINVTPIEPPPP
ncbi:hypothetical protein GALMADRAFT_157070 [Galerina marginata CBS 339.88]|uniref:Phosphoinositide phospholipase C n=1 Tax=Galerina marginata (strain CBS 339.88) TaxID=685588 RepID=A0A067SYQ3_GALM3|nr:hypothetical protein GALMADRAFT_157070 [Galerina marginata CBS 339.88]